MKPNWFIIINTDNFGGDYPDESAICTIDSKGKQQRLLLRKERAEQIAAILNEGMGGEMSPRYWAVRPEDHKLEGPFEP